MIVFFSMNLEKIRNVFRLIFSRHQYLIDYLVKIYKATSNLAELVGIWFSIFGTNSTSKSSTFGKQLDKILIL